MSLRNDGVLVGEIKDNIEQLLQYVPGSKEEFMHDHKAQDAIALRLAVIGEDMRSLSNDFREKYPDLPWRQAIGLRNIITHEYGQLDFERVWVLLHNDFQAFRQRIDEIADELGVS